MQEHFRSQEYFSNHKKRIGNKKPVCESNRKCGTCGDLAFSDKNTNVTNAILTCATRTERYDIYVICNRWRTCCHQATEYCTYSKILNRRRIRGTLHVRNLVCIQQFCSRCGRVDDVRHKSEQCAKRKNSFWGSFKRYAILSLRITTFDQADNCNRA